MDEFDAEYLEIGATFRSARLNSNDVCSWTFGSIAESMTHKNNEFSNIVNMKHLAPCNI